MSLYSINDFSPIVNGTLHERYKMQASLLWARGLPAPTADEIADAMMKVLVKVEPCEHGNYARHPIEHTIRIAYLTVDGLVEKTKVDYVLCDGTPEATDVVPR